MTETPKKPEHYVEVRDLLDQGARFHGDLAAFCNSLAGEAGQQRVKLLLDYMSTHEANLKAGLTIVETPTATNSYTLVVELHDNPQGGSADYLIELTLGR